MRVTLVIPPSGFLLDERVFMSLGVLKVAAVLEQDGVDVDVLDLSGVADPAAATRAHAEARRPTHYGITATTPQLPAAVQIAKAATEVLPYVNIILGGPHVTLVNAAAKREQAKHQHGRATKALAGLREIANVLVAGDGERTIGPALRSSHWTLIDADDPKSPYFLDKAALDDGPFPARHLLDVDSYHFEIDGVRSMSLIGQLGCPFGCGFSVTGDTRVFTDDGPTEIRELAMGVGLARACSHGPSMLEYPISRTIASPLGRSVATRAIAEGVRPILRVTVEGGLSVKSTLEHQFLCVVDERLIWKRADALTTADTMVIRRPELKWADEHVTLKPPVIPPPPPGGFTLRGHTIPTVLDEQLAWLAGFVVGDGSLPTDGRPSFHVCVTETIKAQLTAAIRDCFGVQLAVSSASNTEHMEHGWVHSRLAREVLVQSLGIDPHDKFKIPAIFWKSPRTVLRAFLRGLLDADGYATHERGEYLTTASERLAQDVAYASLVLGDGCPTIRRVQSGSDVSYRVGLLANDRIPTSRCLYRDAAGQWRWRTHRSIGRLGIRRRTLNASGLHHPLNKDGWYYVRVRSIETALAEPVFDITVPGEEAFIANGFVAHNCGGRLSPTFRNIRTRSVHGIVDELEHLYRLYDVTGFMFLDDEVNVSTETIPMLDAIAEAQDRLGVRFTLRGHIKAQLLTDAQAAALVRAGFTWIFVGFESGHEQILTNMQKRSTRAQNTRCVEIARRHGLQVKALMSVGHPGETAETIEATRQWLLDVAVDDFGVSVITTYPGTPYYDEAVETSPGIWTYRAPSGDLLHAIDVDYRREAAYFKGAPGAYRSFVFTDALAPEELVRLRDEVETDVRDRLRIAWPTGPAMQYEQSMGQTVEVSA